MLEILGGGVARESTTTVVKDKNMAITSIGGVGEGKKEPIK